ncbi:hypothetical protein Back2_04450 [Nocardioides baekrokdamisoli]|uniref:Uncharacterized protein n=1 Tax=Nocardioides baekrokdamisoli TaxID=1804624 RepID=A0A3G9IXY6_9ACTN|nr:hypothetical protein [Nocardioides baekrokdamisoli]BBH16158.1 hypothetical protein Back2_04450 [Nocardioides baekrokdamisoli]
MALSNADLTRKTNNLAETLGYVQDGVDALRVDMRRQGRSIRRLEVDVAELKTDVAELKTGVTHLSVGMASVGSKIDEVLRRLPEAG